MSPLLISLSNTVRPTHYSTVSLLRSNMFAEHVHACERLITYCKSASALLYTVDKS